MEKQPTPGGQASSITLAVRALEEGRADKAIPLLQFAATTDPGSFEAHYHLGRAYLARESLTQAEQSARKALEISPNSVPGYCLLGTTLFRLQQYGEARQALEAALRLDSSCQEAAEMLERIPRPEDRAVLLQMTNNPALSPAKAAAPQPTRMIFVVCGMFGLLMVALIFSFAMVQSAGTRTSPGGGAVSSPAPAPAGERPPTETAAPAGTATAPDSGAPAGQAILPPPAASLVDAIVVAQQNYRADHGRYATLLELEQVGQLPSGAAAGAPISACGNARLTETPPDKSTFRITITMPDGTAASVDQDRRAEAGQ